MMFRRVLAAALLIACPALADVTVTGSGSSGGPTPVTTVGALGTCDNSTQGARRTVTDALNATTCSSSGGSSRNVCRCDDNVWELEGVGTVGAGDKGDITVGGTWEIDADTVTATEIATDAVTAPDIATDAVGSSEIAADAVGTSEIATGGVASAEVADNTLTASDLATVSVALAQSGADAVGTSEIATDGVAAAEIAAGAVGTSEISDASIAAADIASDAVTEAKLKATNSATDEYYFTYESTTGDFEWEDKPQVATALDPLAAQTAEATTYREQIRLNALSALHIRRSWGPLAGEGTQGFESQVPVAWATADAACAPSFTVKAVTGITAANPAVVTASSHGFSNGDFVTLSTVRGMVEINGGPYKVAGVTTNTFQLQNAAGTAIDSSSYTAYSSGGYATKSVGADNQTIYLVSGTSGCTSSGSATEACLCFADGQQTSALYPLQNSAKTIWKHFFETDTAGSDPGVAGNYYINVPDWSMPWAELYGAGAGDCTQEQWVPGTGNHVGPYWPVSGHTVTTVIRAGLSSVSQDDMDETYAFWGFVEEGNGDVLIDPDAATAAAALKGITNGYGILWFEYQFYYVSVRASVETIVSFYDLSDAGDRANFRSSQRGLITAVIECSLVTPAAGGSDTSTQCVLGYQTGFFTLGGSAGTGTDNFKTPISVQTTSPSGLGGQVPVVTSCTDDSSTTGVADTYFGSITQVVNEHGF